MTPAKSLISRIRRVLSVNDVEFSVEDLARDFADLCSDACSRLDKCRSVSVPEDVVKIAEDGLPLIDILEPVEKFPLFGEWLTYCEHNSLAIPDQIAPGATAELIEIYKKWPGINDFLWKKYRDAAIRKDDALLLSFAGRILKINPSDKAAKDETRRILRRYFRDEIKELDELVKCEDRLSAMGIVDRLDQLPFDDLKKGEAWKTAIQWLNAERRASDEKRAFKLLSGLPAQCDDHDLESVKVSVSELDSLIKTHKFDLGEEGSAKLLTAKSWIIEEEERIKLEANSKDVLERFSKEVAKLESNWQVVIKSPVKEVESARRKLTNCWAEVEKIGLDVDSEVSEKVSNYQSQLDDKIGKLKRKIRRKRRTVILTVSLIIFSTSFFLYAQWRSETMKAEFANYKVTRTVRPFESLVKSTETFRAPIAFLARMGPELRKARGWLGIELDHHRALYEKINELDTEADADFGRPINEYWDEFTKLRKGISEAATDLKVELNEHKSSLEGKWDSHLNAYISKQRGRRRSVLDEIGTILKSSPKLTVVARDEQFVLKVNSVNQEFDDSMREVIPPTILRANVKEEARNLGPHIKDLIARIDSFKDVLKQAEQATTYAEFKEAIRLFMSEKFVGTPEQAAANSFIQYEKEHVDVVGEIIRPGQSKGWTVFLANRNKDQIFPKDIEEAERVVLNELSEDEKFVNLYKCFFTEIPSGRTFYRYCDGPTKLRNRKVGPSSIIERSGYFFDDTKFVSTKYELFASGKFELKDERLKAAKGITLTGEELTPEAQLFNKIRPTERMMSQSQQYYREGILKIFDDILLAENVSPLYRAYLQTELAKAIFRRPHEWGILLAPKFSQDLKEIGQAKPTILGRNDWMNESRYPLKEEAIKAFYNSRSEQSYMLEAKINRGLIDGVIENGFGYAGYVNIDGSLILQDAAKAAKTLYGSLSPEKYATVVYRKPGTEEPDLLGGGNVNGWKSQGNVAPFTPLLYFKGDRKAVIASVTDAEGLTEAKVRAYAVPFFTELK